jgi:hypothetical protein
VELHLFWTVVPEASSAAAILISHLQNSSRTKETPYYMFRVRYLLAACLLLSRRELLCNQFTKHKKSMQKSGDNHHHAYSSFLFPKRIQKPMEAFLIIINEGVPLTVLDQQRTVDSFLQLCYNLRRLPSEEGVCPLEKTASTPPECIFFLRFLDSLRM